MTSKLTNTEVLCFVLGWQGGTVHEVARTLQVEIDAILDADHDEIADLCRKAQKIHYNDVLASLDDEDCDQPEPDESMDGDFDSAMESAGHGTDEDYGYFGGNEDF